MTDATRTDDSPPPWLPAVVNALAQFADVHIPWVARSKVESLVRDLFLGERGLAPALADSLVLREDVIDSLLEEYCRAFLEIGRSPAKIEWDALRRRLEDVTFRPQSSDERVAALVHGLIVEASDDVVPFSSVPWQLQQLRPPLDPSDVHAMALEVIRQALSREQVVVGQFEESNAVPSPFVRWSDSLDGSLERIEREWNALGRDVNPGEIAWFISPRLLPYALCNPMG